MTEAAQQMDTVYTRAVIEYNVTNQKLTELKDKYADMDASTREGYLAVTKGIAEIRGYRTSVERHRKELKKDALDYGRRIDAEAKRITTALVEIEQPMKDLKQAVDDEKVRQKAEAERIERERVEAIRAQIDKFFSLHRVNELLDKPPTFISTAIEQVNAMVIGDEFQELQDEAQQAKDTLLMGLERLHDRKQAQEVEDQRRREEEARLAEERRKLEEEQARIRAEQQRIRKQQEAQQAEIDAERARLQAAEDKRLKEERERQIREKALQDAKEQAEREAREKALAEEAARLEAERQESLKPEKDRLMDFADGALIDLIESTHALPKTEEGEDIMEFFRQDVYKAYRNLVMAIEAL